MKYLDSRDCPAWMNAVICLMDIAICLWIWLNPERWGPEHSRLIWFAYGAWAFDKNFTQLLEKLAGVKRCL